MGIFVDGFFEACCELLLLLDVEKLSLVLDVVKDHMQLGNTQISNCKSTMRAHIHLQVDLYGGQEGFNGLDVPVRILICDGEFIPGSDVFEEHLTLERRCVHGGAFIALVNFDVCSLEHLAIFDYLVGRVGELIEPR